jgi:hypothetical protein
MVKVEYFLFGDLKVIEAFIDFEHIMCLYVQVVIFTSVNIMELFKYSSGRS